MKRIIVYADFDFLTSPEEMCNFAAELKYVANKEKLVDIQWDNTF